MNNSKQMMRTQKHLKDSREHAEDQSVSSSIHICLLFFFSPSLSPSLCLSLYLSDDA